MDDAKFSGAGVSDSANIVSKIASVVIGAQVFGTPNSLSSSDHYGFVTALTTKSDIREAVLNVSGNLKALTIGGSLIGGTGIGSGSITVGGNFGPIKIGGDLAGGAGNSSGQIVTNTGAIASVTIGHSLSGGGDTNAGYIFCQNNLGPVKIGGDLRGGSGGDSSEIKTFGNILAGYNSDNAVGVNPDAQIGKINVGGDWIASNAIAGAYDKNGDGFGNADDAKIISNKDDPNVISGIASIVIGGQVLGTVGGTDHFGFEAEQIGSFKVGGTAIPPTLGPHNDNRPIGVTGAVTVREI